MYLLHIYKVEMFVGDKLTINVIIKIQHYLEILKLETL